jgi:hypothetical protein
MEGIEELSMGEEDRDGCDEVEGEKREEAQEPHRRLDGVC